jgi:hypothetical protein
VSLWRTHGGVVTEYTRPVLSIKTPGTALYEIAMSEPDMIFYSIIVVSSPKIPTNED